MTKLAVLGSAVVQLAGIAAAAYQGPATSLGADKAGRPPSSGSPRRGPRFLPSRTHFLRAVGPRAGYARRWDPRPGGVYPGRRAAPAQRRLGNLRPVESALTNTGPPGSPEGDCDWPSHERGGRFSAFRRGDNCTDLSPEEGPSFPGGQIHEIFHIFSCPADFSANRFPQFCRRASAQFSSGQASRGFVQMDPGPDLVSCRDTR